MSINRKSEDRARLEDEIERMLATDAVELAANCFVAIFPGVQLGRELASGKIRKWLKQQFGNPRWTEANTYAFDAVTAELLLIFERARVAYRQISGTLLLLPRGVQLLDAPDPVAALRELL